MQYFKTISLIHNISNDHCVCVCVYTLAKVECLFDGRVGDIFTHMCKLDCSSHDKHENKCVHKLSHYALVGLVLSSAKSFNREILYR